MLNFIEDLFINDLNAPQSVINHPAMLGPGDRSVYYNSARKFYKLKGSIVDAGVFLGGTTKAFLEGARSNPKFTGSNLKKITVFDRFIVGEQAYQDFIRKLNGKNYEYTDSFRGVFDELMGQDAEALDIQEGDFLEKEYSHPFIELLGLDICKSRALTLHAARVFFPRMRAFESMMIHQDYVHIWTPWIHVMMEAFDNYFTKTAEIDSCGVFLCTNEISPEETSTVLSSLSDIPRAVKLMNRSLSKSQTHRAHFTISMAKAKLLCDHVGAAQAMDCLNSTVLHGMTGAELPDGDRHRGMYNAMKRYIETRSR